MAFGRFSNFSTISGAFKPKYSGPAIAVLFGSIPLDFLPSFILFKINFHGAVALFPSRGFDGRSAAVILKIGFASFV